MYADDEESLFDAMVTYAVLFISNTSTQFKSYACSCYKTLGSLVLHAFFYNKNDILKSPPFCSASGIHLTPEFLDGPYELKDTNVLL